MILTDKAKQDFGDQCFYQFEDFKKLTESCQNALIIEWLDSVGIFISIHYLQLYNDLEDRKGFVSIVTNKHLSTKFREVETRTEATQKAIEKANEIYNNLNTKQNEK
jgi:hypothetical protein